MPQDLEVDVSKLNPKELAAYKLIIAEKLAAAKAAEGGGAPAPGKAASVGFDINTGIGGPEQPKTPGGYGTADYIQGIKGFIKNPFRPDAKTKGTIRVRVGDKEQEMTIGENLPDELVPAMIKQNIAAQNSALNPDNMMNAANNFMQAANPLPALWEGYKDPIGMIKRASAAQSAEFEKALGSYREGDYQKAIGHGLAYALPLIGPAAASAGEQFQRGDISGGIGTSAALLAPEIPGMLQMKDLPISVNIKGRMISPNPKEASAVRFGMREGLPVDVGTATGNPVVRGVQAISDNTVIGGILSRRRRAAAATKFANKLDELANTRLTGKAEPAILPPQAGESMFKTLDNGIATHNAIADTAYDSFREFHKDPKNVSRIQVGVEPAKPLDFHQMMSGERSVPTPIFEDIPMAVDQGALKGVLGPMVEEWRKTMPVAQQDASPGLRAAQNILDGPDFVPASVADKNLGRLKALERGADSEYTRNISQGIAAKTIGELSKQIDEAVARAGPEAVDALKRGREATATKYAIKDVRDSLAKEPVQAFDQVVYSRDASINKLRNVAKYAPGELPNIGRAFLNEISETMTAEGGFTKAKGAWAKWSKMGPETKKLLFKDPAYIKNLDDFFLLAKKIEESPNPSRTALLGQTGAEMAGAFYAPLHFAGGEAVGGTLSKLLHSPRAVQLAVNGLKYNGKIPAAAVTAALTTSNLATQLEENSRRQQLQMPANVPTTTKK